MNGFCPHCEKESPLEMFQADEEINVRGELITVRTIYYRCPNCGSNFDIITPEDSYDPLAAAYEEYRCRKGMVQPAQIKEFRKKYGLSQKDLADLLGIGVATLSRYENGALQEEAHDQLLQFGMDPHNLIILVEKSTKLSEDKRQQLIQKLNLEDPHKISVDTLLDLYGNYGPSIYSGYKRFDATKFYEAIRFFCYPNGVYKTKLNKLLFYADFLFYKETTVSITGAKYAHAHHGPVPDNFEYWFSLLLADASSFESHEMDCGDVTGEQYRSLIQPEIAVFDTAELVVLARVKDKFEHSSSRKIREISHSEKGYLETISGELISYSYADSLNFIDKAG